MYKSSVSNCVCLFSRPTGRVLVSQFQSAMEPDRKKYWLVRQPYAPEFGEQKVVLSF